MQKLIKSRAHIKSIFLKFLSAHKSKTVHIFCTSFFKTVTETITIAKANHSGPIAECCIYGQRVMLTGKKLKQQTT
jgi:hypothetical protein